MLHAVSFALLDSVNVLLIGIIVALGAMLPRKGRYGMISTLLVFGDWLGVLVLCVIVMFVFGGIDHLVQQFLESPLFGILLIATGVISLLLTRFGKGESTEMINRFLAPVRTPSWLTVVAGFVLGIIQSATSLPFYAGLAFLSAGDFADDLRYGGLVLYATLALSLSIITALLVGWVRRYPSSPIGMLFDAAGRNRGRVAKASGYLVAALLCAIGIGALL
ncbi:hypothetical protein [Corynebacterium pacaense]|uniref:hypothetical protein n=1 Tax=Corynebacterium pacaense TaxID=1816684 RepID=UPI0009BAD3CB|nr:hypothetical protein [Corynebacterium pacaense]